jgi:aspartate kinase
LSLETIIINQIVLKTSKIMKPIKVFKFGGASLRDADNIRNVAHILRTYGTESLVIAVSAMGKTTNALEEVVRAYFAQSDKTHDLLEKVKQNHYALMNHLFDIKTNKEVYSSVNDTFVEIEWILEDAPHDAFDYVYDQIVSIGEVVSSKIVAGYLNHIGLKTTWLDARDMVLTDDTWREAIVQRKETAQQIRAKMLPALEKGGFVLTQGFLGSTKDNNTTTLGREGTDYSAALYANAVDAQGMYIWKDVQGVLTGDPRVFKNLVKLDKIGYSEAIEMTYYGATVVHPRTIAPLMQKNIPLHVRSFLDLTATGTVIGGADSEGLTYPPILMTERNQIFMKVWNKDLTFLIESHIRDLFDIFAKYSIFVNLLQNSGLYFFLSITNKPEAMTAVLKALSDNFNVERVDGCDLITIRHYNDAKIKELQMGKQLIFEKRIPQTYQMVVSE